MSKLEQIKELNAKIKAAQEESRRLIGDKAKELFAEIAKPVFDKYPKLKSFALIGYTPGFNDGDPCEFTYNATPQKINGYGNPNYCEDEPDEIEDQYKITDNDWEDGKEWDSTLRKSVQVKEQGWAYKASKEIVEAFDFLTEDQIEDMFGTNFELVVSINDGVVTVEKDDYDCGH